MNLFLVCGDLQTFYNTTKNKTLPHAEAAYTDTVGKGRKNISHCFTCIFSLVSVYVKWLSVLPRRPPSVLFSWGLDGSCVCAFTEDNNTTQTVQGGFGDLEAPAKDHYKNHHLLNTIMEVNFVFAF